MKYPGIVSTIGLTLLTCVAACGTPEPSPTVFRHTDAASLFGVDHVPQFEFTVQDQQWQWLQANATKEEYVRADVRYEGQPAGTIGLRFKGSVGTLANCYDQTGKLACSKLSFSLNFEKYDGANRFFGLTRLNLHSMVGDPTKLHERIAYDLFQLSHIKAPRSSWANVNVNGKSYGLFSMVEAVDGDFTADRWPGNGHGNLYKEAWPKSTMTALDYARALETNKGSFAIFDWRKPAAIVAFADDLARSQPPELTAVLAKWTDLPYMARYMAVDDVLANCDGVTAMYFVNAVSPMSNNHNYYVYQEQHRDVFWLIPWDLDLTLAPCRRFAAVPRWSTPPAHCDRHYPVWGGSWVEEPGCDRLFQAMAQAHGAYQAAVDQLLAGSFNEQMVLKKIDRWVTFIRDSEAADPTTQGDGSWMSAVKELKSTIPVLRERLLAIRDGRPLAPLSLSLGNNDFETATSLGAQVACATRASVNSDVRQEVRTTDALDGHQDIRVTFVYRDPSGSPDEAWRQWIQYSMPLADGARNLTSVTHVRLLLRTDQPRTVRIELESDRYSPSNKGLKFGWDVAVTNSPTPVDLMLENARLPSSAKGTNDALRQVRTGVSSLVFRPSVVGRNASGYLGPGKSDGGYLQIDDIQFSTQ